MKEEVNKILRRPYSHLCNIRRWALFVLFRKFLLCNMQLVGTSLALNGSLSPDMIKHCIYEQWLVADLQEIGSSCLPDSIFSNEKNTLHGIYALQMLDIRDINQPCYSLLLKLRGKDNQNSGVSADPLPPAQPWEIKPKRMLMMTITDGNKSLQAVEYKPIASLHCGLAPGTKVQICGPVECRLGILLLTAENIHILGGEVESLIVENSYEKVLRRKLGCNDDVLEDRNSSCREGTQSFDSGFITSDNNSELQHVQNNTNSLSLHWNSVEQTSRNSSLLHRTTNHKGVRDNRNALTLSDAAESFPESINKRAAVDEFGDDDEFLTNLDYDLLDQLAQGYSGTPSEEDKSKTPLDSSSHKIHTPPPMLSDLPDWEPDDFV